MATKLTELFEKYQKYVVQNKDVMSYIENAVRCLSYLVAGNAYCSICGFCPMHSDNATLQHYPIHTCIDSNVIISLSLEINH